jgi:dTDP-glucose pyrophosphorylase
MQAVILAAGIGERMAPFTEVLPKPLLPIDGRPVLQSVLEILEQCEIKNVVIVVGYLKEKIMKYVGAGEFGVRVDYAYQDRAEGSGDALKKARDLVDQDFLVIAADTVFDPSEIKEMVAYFNASDIDALIGLKKVDAERIKRGSTVRVGPDGVIEQIIEKPEKHRILSDISAAPVFIFSSKIWPYLQELKPSRNGKYELATAIQDLINNEGKVKGCFLSYSRDITRPIDVLRENFVYLKELVDV